MDHEEGDVQLYIESWNRINRWILECKMNWILDQENELDSGVGDERDTRAGSWMNWVVEQNELDPGMEDELHEEVSWILEQGR